MNAKTVKPTAKIYAFPAGGRANAGAKRIGAQSAVTPIRESIVTGDFGDCWYHAAAIQDGKLPHQR